MKRVCVMAALAALSMGASADWVSSGGSVRRVDPPAGWPAPPTASGPYSDCDLATALPEAFAPLAVGIAGGNADQWRSEFERRAQLAARLAQALREQWAPRARDAALKSALASVATRLTAALPRPSSNDANSWYAGNLTQSAHFGSVAQGDREARNGGCVARDQALRERQQRALEAEDRRAEAAAAASRRAAAAATAAAGAGSGGRQPSVRIVGPEPAPPVVDRPPMLAP